jgi:PAS domain S-box-containing protein
MRSLDWSKTPIGDVESWSPALQMIVRLILTNRQQTLIWWGERFCQMYNDAFWPALGDKHPRSMGQPASECWPEIWHIIGPLIETPFRGGEPSWMEDIFLEMNRHGFTEETHWTIAYSPVADETVPSGIGGVIGIVHEITVQVVGERRVSALRDLGSRSTEAKSVEEACTILTETLSQYTADVPFALVYLLDGNRKIARLFGTAGMEIGTADNPIEIELGYERSQQPWPLAEAVRSETMQVVEDLHDKLTSVPAGPWSDPPRSAVVLPIRASVAHELAGLIVLGISSRLAFDDRYRDFAELVTSQVAAVITNARAYEEERRRADALAEIDRAKTAFFSNVSHEFRTPLTLMLGPVEDMLTGATDSVIVRREELDLVHRNALRLLKLVNTLLDFSRIEAGRVQAIYEPMDLGAFTADLASIFRAAIEKAGLQLIVDCPPLNELVYVDRSMWEKIVLNLLSNAFKFTFEGEIKTCLRITAETVALSVSDTGTGIPEHELPHLFERFHRIEHARGRTFEGSGIGLALVQELVKLHGGSVRVESTYGVGSRFTVSIPLGHTHLPKEKVAARSNQRFATAGANAYLEEALRWLPDAPVIPVAVKDHGVSPEQTPRAEARILFADDNADLRQYVRQLLSGSYKIDTVNDGEAALAVARRNPPDLVLTDVMMPLLDGFGLLSALRDDPRTRNVPVIMLSARAGEEARVEGLAAGADDYLVKPFTARELLVRVSARLEIARTNREAVERERELRRAAEDREGLVQLHELGTRLMLISETQPLFEEILHATIAIQKADFGRVQLYDPRSGALQIVAQSGFKQNFLDYIASIDNCGGGSACSRALQQSERIIIEDVLTDPDFAPHRAIAASAGFRAVQSAPLFSRGGQPLAIVSTHFRQPHRPSDRELRLTDLYGRQAANMIERQNAAEALRASEERFRRYFDLGLIGMAMSSPDKGFLEINDELCRILGYRRTELLKLSWPDITHPDDLAADMVEFDRVMAGEIDGYSLDKRWIRKDGQVIHSILSAKCLRRVDGSVDYFVKLVLDTTQRKLAEEKLAESERRFRLLAESIPHHVWSARPDSSASFCNQRLINYTGLSEEDLLWGGWKTVHPDDLETVKSAWEIVWAKGTTYELEQRMRGRDGRYRRFTCRAQAVKDAQGRAVEWFGTNTDIEVAKQAEEALHKTQIELAHLTRVTTMGELAASIAHEINQPLGAIINNSNFCLGLLARSSNPDSDICEAISDILSDARRAGDIIQRIRGMAYRTPPERTTLDFKDVIADVLALTRRELAEHRIEVRTEFAEDVPPVSADRVQLQQVLLNLVMNGIDAMSGLEDERRKLTISGSRDELADRLSVRISVSDLGTGFRLEDRERLFEAFYTTKSHGMGMGLRVSRSIVTALGGQLLAEPNVGPGTTFSCILPGAT